MQALVFESLIYQSGLDLSKKKFQNKKKKFWKLKVQDFCVT